MRAVLICLKQYVKIILILGKFQKVPIHLRELPLRVYVFRLTNLGPIEGYRALPG